MEGVGEGTWRRIKDACSKFDVEENSHPENVWDVRDYGTDEDAIILWGRDGWRNGYWHARITRDGSDVWIERGSDDEANELTHSRKRFTNVVQPLLAPTQEKDDGEQLEPDLSRAE